MLTPEEWVRRHLIACLVAHCGAPARRIVQEYAVALNGQPQRADVVVVDDAGGAAAAGRVQGSRSKIDARVLDQAVRYNSVLGARYLVLTNGLTHRCYACSPERGYAALEHFSPALTQRLPHARFPAAFPKQHPAARAGFAAPDKSRSRDEPAAPRLKVPERAVDVLLECLAHSFRRSARNPCRSGRRGP